MEETTVMQQEPVEVETPVTPPIPAEMTEQPKTNEAAEGKVGFWTYFGLMALFAIPVIGWIAGIVFMFAPKRKSLKNFARATMAWVLVGILFVAAIFLALQAFVTSLLKNEFGLEFKSFGQMIEVIGEVQNGNYVAVLPYIGDEFVEQVVDVVGEEYEEVVEEVLSGEYNGLLENIQDRKFEKIAKDLDKGKYDDLVELLDEDTYTSLREELDVLENGDTPDWLAEFESMIPELPAF